MGYGSGYHATQQEIPLGIQYAYTALKGSLWVRRLSWIRIKTRLSGSSSISIDVFLLARLSVRSISIPALPNSYPDWGSRMNMEPVTST